MAIIVGLLACLTACGGGTPATSGTTSATTAAPTTGSNALPTIEILGGTSGGVPKSPTVSAAIPPPTGTLTTRVAAVTRTATTGATPAASGTPGTLPGGRARHLR